MAVGNYFDVYNVEEYKERVSNIASGISELRNGNFFIEAKSKIERQIKNLEEKERQIFKILNVRDIKELNERLEEYKQAVLNLSGAGLNQAFIAILSEKNKQEFEAFNEAVLSVIYEDLLENKTIEDLGVEKVKNKVLELLNTNRPKYATYSSPKGMTGTQFFPASFTTEQKNRWIGLLKEKYRYKPQVQKYFEVAVMSNNDTMVGEFTWFDMTSQMTQTEARDRLTSAEVDEINRKIKNFILSKVNNDKTLISSIIDYVLSEQGNKYVFFVGKNEKDITGILGEIQGLYYISKFLGGLTPALQWRGGTYTGEGSKKPHQDILLDKFGIQVKNTTKEALFGLGQIEFASANIEGMLSKTGISSYAANVFLNYYGTLGFNIAYHRDRRKKRGAQYLPGLRESDKGANIYKEQRGKLESYQKDIDTLLSLFSASFMYLDVAESAASLDANSLFLLGGVAFQTASQILSDVLAQLEKDEKRFKVNASLKTDKNIITALNASSKGAGYSDLVVNDIKLTSSFRF